MLYIQSIRAEAQQYGICKVIPPEDWSPPPSIDAKLLKFTTRKQRIDLLHCRDLDGDGYVAEDDFGFEEGDEYDLPRYESMSNQFKHTWFYERKPQYTDVNCMYHIIHGGTGVAQMNGIRPLTMTCICPIPPAVIIAQYWSIVESGDHLHPVTVEYGSDLDTSESGSGFPTSGVYARSGWNLNRLPSLPKSLLKHLTNISGVTMPWMYIGMLFSSFCFHTEDHYTYSINYVHSGSSKQWYGIPSYAATAFETIARMTLPHLFRKQPELLFHMVTMVSPSKLQEKGVPVYAITQHAGEFVLTFPQAYHGGFNHGVNIAEVNQCTMSRCMACARRAMHGIYDHAYISVSSSLIHRV
jgi:histone demethylase JARID1